MKIYIAQTNPKIADIAYNLTIIKYHIDQAREKKATIIVFGELAITGYALKDLFLNSTIIKQTAKAIKELQIYCPDIAVVIGYPKKDSLSNKLLNTAGVFYQGKLILEYYKKALVDFECFNESRYFTKKTNCQNTFSIQDHTFALSICHDIWDEKTMPEISATKVDGIINISASPYEIDKDLARDLVLTKAAKQHNCTIIYTNIVGGHDGLIFDG
jgi:NAD+ synthase (glutamine-hydrolysing)